MAISRIDAAWALRKRYILKALTLTLALVFVHAASPGSAAAQRCDRLARKVARRRARLARRRRRVDCTRVARKRNADRALARRLVRVDRAETAVNRALAAQCRHCPSQCPANPTPITFVKAQPTYGYLVFEDTNDLLKSTDWSQWSQAKRAIAAIETGFRSVHADDSRFLVILTTPHFRDTAFNKFVESPNTCGIGFDHWRQSFSQQRPGFFPPEGSIFDASPDSRITNLVWLDDWHNFANPGALNLWWLSRVLSQELAHTWGPWVDTATGCPSLLGQEFAHWSFYFDTDGSPLEGLDWTVDQSGTTFTGTNPSVRTFTDLDLYLMGLGPSTNVAPMFTIASPSQCTLDGSPVACPKAEARGISVTGTYTVQGSACPVTMADVLVNEGPRIPSWTAAGNDVLPVSVLLITHPGEVLDPNDEASVGEIVATLPDLWNQATGGLSTLVNNSTAGLAVDETANGAVYTVATCNEGLTQGPVIVYLPGTGGSPWNPAYLTSVASRGLCAFAVPYDNAQTTGQCCSTIENNPDGPTDPACLQAVMGSKATGNPRTYTCKDQSTGSNTYADSIEGQIATTLVALELTGYYTGQGQQALPRWNRLLITGHSQGAVFSAYIAVARHKLYGAGLLAGGVQPVVGGGYAPWAAQASKTPSQSIRAFHHINDADTLRQAAYAFLNIPKKNIRTTSDQSAGCALTPHGCIRGSRFTPWVTGRPVFEPDWLWLTRQ